MTQEVSTIADLLEAAGANWRIFDLGRKVQKIPSAEFDQFEDTQIAYPYPIQQHAFFAVLFWNKDESNEHFVWFLKMPLDEQGKLIQATRNHFASMVLNSLGKNFVEKNKAGEELNNNPYVFTPNQNKLALFNAMVKVELKQPASQYYEHARTYLSGQIGWDNWHSVGVQGLADLSQRLNFDDNDAIVTNSLTHISEQVESALAATLESATISTKLAEKLAELIQTELSNSQLNQSEINLNRIFNWLRMLSSSKAAGIKQKVITSLLNSDIGNDIDLLSVIVGRCWDTLTEPSVSMLFLEKLADNAEGFAIFHALVSDLVAIPSVRPYIMLGFRSEEKSAKLAENVGLLFNPVSANSPKNH